jgi:hypothetical protein
VLLATTGFEDLPQVVFWLQTLEKVFFLEAIKPSDVAEDFWSTGLDSNICFYCVGRIVKVVKNATLHFSVLFSRFRRQLVYGKFRFFADHFLGDFTIGFCKCILFLDEPLNIEHAGTLKKATFNDFNFLNLQDFHRLKLLILENLIIRKHAIATIQLDDFLDPHQN